jgi:hypothetical protein
MRNNLMMNNESISHAVRIQIPFGQNALIDAYELPNGERRLGVTGASQALGYSKEWFGRLPSKAPKHLKALQATGFTGCLVEAQVKREFVRGASDLKTISTSDFTKLVTYEAVAKQNIKAIVILASLAETGLDKLLNDAFNGHNTDYLLQRIVHYSQWTTEELEEVLQYNRSEVKSLFGRN